MFQIYFLNEKLAQEFKTFEEAFRCFQPMVEREVKEGTPLDLVASTSWIQTDTGFLPGNGNPWDNTVCQAYEEGLMAGDDILNPDIDTDSDVEEFFGLNT